MSDRGSILISTANDIGEALVEKLGGEGYAPSVWDKEYNKLGIAEVDSAPALSVLEDSSETGTARGSILLSTANAIGAMLNKKYNTDRGFKPKEWASAGRKMKALETDTKSGSIVNIQGAKETPLLSLVGTINPTIEGTSEVNAYKLGKNLINANDESKTFSENVVTNYDVASLELKKGVTYTFSANQNTAITGSTRNTLRITFDGNYTYESTASNYHNQAGVHSMSITPAQDGTAVFAIWAHTPAEDVTYSDFMVEVGSSASAYEPYKAPTTYTADLGRTVYGGTADIVNGTGSGTYTKVKLSDLTWTQGTAGGREYYNAVIATAETTNTHDIVTDMTYSGMVTVANMTDKSIAKWQQSVRIYDTDISSVTQLLEVYGDEYIVYPNRYTEDFTFDGQEINTSGDVENYYTSAGDTSIEYYAVPTPYTRGTASGAIANVQSARTDLPFTKVKANIAPNLTGVESVEVNKCGVNLFDKTAITPNTWIIVNSTSTEASNSYSTSDYIPVSAGKRYFVSFKDSNRSAYYDRNKNGIEYFSFNGNASFTALYDGYIRVTIKNDINLDTFIINEGNDEATYEQYNKTTYTADLGEPVYGGYADLVSGTGKRTHGKYSVTGQETGDFLAGPNNNGNRIGFRIVGAQTPLYTGGISNIGENKPFLASSTWTVDSWCIYTDNKLYFVVPNEYTTFAAALEYLVNNNATFVFPLATQEDFTFDGQVISPSEGVNNLWNNAGGDTDVEYFEQE